MKSRHWTRDYSGRLITEKEQQRRRRAGVLALYDYFGEFAAVACCLNITKERARQIVAKAKREREWQERCESVAGYVAKYVSKGAAAVLSPSLSFCNNSTKGKPCRASGEAVQSAERCCVDTTQEVR